jgi:hypothetical protein
MMSKKEQKVEIERKNRIEWIRNHHFREIECCYSCKHSKCGQNKDRKDPVFINCEFAEKTIGKPFVIIDSNFICDDWEPPESGPMKTYGYESN